MTVLSIQLITMTVLSIQLRRKFVVQTWSKSLIKSQELCEICHKNRFIQLKFTCSKLMMKTPEQCVKSVQSQH